METRKVNRLAAALCVFAATRLFGADLIWTGAADGKWGTGVNWTNGAGVAVAFSAGDNVRFEESASVRSVALSATVTAGDILFDGGLNYTLTNAAGGKIGQASSFVKRGAGTLFLSCFGHTFTNNVRIEGGTVMTTQPNTTSDSPLGRATAERQIYVSTNAALRFGERNTLGGAETTNLLAEVYVDRGLFELGYPGVATKGVTTLGSLTLNDGQFAYTNLMGNTTYGVLKICRTFRLLGTVPYFFRNYGSSGCFMLLNSEPYTEFNVADITASTNEDATLELALKEYAGKPGGLIKTGAGTLKLATAGSAFTGNVEVREGELLTAAAKTDTNNAATVLGNARVSRSITVYTNAALTFGARNALGTAEGDNPKVAVIVDHGTLNLAADGISVFGPLTLNGGALTYKSGYDATRGVIRLGGALTLKGGQPYFFGVPEGAANCFINLNAAPLTEINVADITGDGAPDAAFLIPLKDFASSNNLVSAAGFVKTGPGTLYLTNAPNNASTFSGDIEVREGWLVAETAGGHPLGNANADRRILVSTNCTLQLRQRNTQGGATATNSLRAEIVVDHGTLLLGDAGVTKGVNTVGSLTLINGVLNYTNMFNEPYGFLKVARTFRLAGTTPYTFAGSTLSGCFMLLNAFPLTTFDVADITGDAEPDATFHFPFKNYPGSTAACGLIKSGAGTMRITAVSTYVGETRVSNGVLRVDGSLASSSGVTVADGGWLGGTGTVKSVTVADGGGFDVIQGQLKPLTVTGALTLTGGGTVRVQNPAGLPGQQIQVVLAEVAGAITGAENADLWTVEIDGVAPSANYRLRVIGSQLVAGYAPHGTLISVR